MSSDEVGENVGTKNFFLFYKCANLPPLFLFSGYYMPVSCSHGSHDTINHILERLNDITRDRVISFLKKDTSDLVRKFKELVAQCQLHFLPCIHGTKLRLPPLLMLRASYNLPNPSKATTIYMQFWSKDN